MARVLRLTRLLFAHKAFELIGIISFDIIPAAVYVILMLLFLMYTFSSLGVILYGGSEFKHKWNYLANAPSLLASLLVSCYSDHTRSKESSILSLVASKRFRGK